MGSVEPSTDCKGINIKSSLTSITDIPTSRHCRILERPIRGKLSGDILPLSLPCPSKNQRMSQSSHLAVIGTLTRNGDEKRVPLVMKVEALNEERVSQKKDRFGKKLGGKKKAGRVWASRIRARLSANVCICRTLPPPHSRQTRSKDILVICDNSFGYLHPPVPFGREGESDKKE